MEGLSPQPRHLCQPKSGALRTRGPLGPRGPLRGTWEQWHQAGHRGTRQRHGARSRCPLGDSGHQHGAAQAPSPPCGHRPRAEDNLASLLGVTYGPFLPICRQLRDRGRDCPTRTAPFPGLHSLALISKELHRLLCRKPLPGAALVAAASVLAAVRTGRGSPISWRRRGPLPAPSSSGLRPGAVPVRGGAWGLRPASGGSARPRGRARLWVGPQGPRRAGAPTRWDSGSPGHGGDGGTAGGTLGGPPAGRGRCPRARVPRQRRAPS